MQTKISLYVETADVARRLGLTSALVRWLVSRGRLIPRARTARGGSLFLMSDIEAYVAERAARARGLR